MLHQLCDRMLSIPNTFLKNRSDKSDSFCGIQFEASCQSFLRECTDLMEKFPGASEKVKKKKKLNKKSQTITFIGRTWWRRILSCSRGRMCMIERTCRTWKPFYKGQMGCYVLQTTN